jgi:hypothetical protein
MGNSNKRKAETLGMPYGTASNRLRKMLLFKLLVHVGAHNCFVCGDEIGSVDELSIEHIEPWEGRPDGAEKFWDLDNIAFSHTKCNRPHTQTGGRNKRQGPEGTSWCPECQEYLSIDLFSKDSSRWDGCEVICKEHKAIKNKLRTVVR